jgi:hypothetical protein
MIKASSTSSRGLMKSSARIARPLHHFEHGWGHVFLALDQHVFPPE